MKFSIAILSMIVASASAFTTTAPSTKINVAVRMSSEETSEAVTEAVAVEPPKPKLPVMSESLPFMMRPPALDGTMVGDVGFDPFGFAKTKEDLVYYREAEIKHSRLAMLAAAGWPLSELFDAKIAKVLGLTPIVDGTDRAPSVLNGGLGKISPVYWVVVLLAASAIDVYGITKAKTYDPTYTPGNLGFDPLGLYPKDEAGQKRMQLAEIKNGRLGMIAITAFAVQEFVYSLGVVDETPLFFKPIGGVLRDYANSGYLN